MIKQKKVIFKLKKILDKYAIVFILLLGAFIRIKGIKFGFPYLYNPDGSFFTKKVVLMMTGKTLNPHWFGHPASFIMYLLLAIYSGFYAVGYTSGIFQNLDSFYQQYLTDPTFFHFSARLMMVVFAILSVYVTYLIGQLIFSKKNGLLAALCLSLAPMHIEFSRYFRTDIPSTMLLIASTYFLLKQIVKKKNKKHQFRNLVFASICSGLAIATKYSAGVGIFPILIYAAIFDYQNHKSFKQFIKNSFRFKTRLVIASFSIFAAFAMFAPFVIIKFKTAWPDIKHEMRSYHLGHESLPGLKNYLWYLTSTLNKGIGGIFFEILSGLGFAYLLLSKKEAKKYFLLFPTLYFLIIGKMQLRWSRWLMPLLPFEAILMSHGYFTSQKIIVRKIKNIGLNKNSQKKLTRIIVAFIYLCLFLAIINNANNNYQQAALLKKKDTRTLAKNWIEKNLPTQSTIVYGWYGPHLHINSKKDFDLKYIRWDKIVHQPLSYYQKQKVDYLLITDPFKSRFFNEPDKYSLEIERYLEIERNTKLIKQFTNQANPGPIIEIYQLSKFTNVKHPFC